MSARYGQKVLPSANKKASSFVSYNRNDLPYTGTAAPFRPVPNSSPYVRPADYLNITPPNKTEQRVVLLVFISNDNSNFLSFTAAGNYTVNWGDGITENIATGGTASHDYNFSTFDPTNATLTSQGFKQAIVTITPQLGQTLTSLNFTIRHPSSLAANAYSQPIEEMYISSPSLTSLTLSSALVHCRKTSYVNLINTGAMTSFASLFINLYGLRKVDIGQTAAIVSTNSMFSSCISLTDITVSNDTNFSSNTTASSMFTVCYSLKTVPLFDTRSVSNMTFMFQDCRSLISVPLFDTRSVSSTANMFRDCRSLTTVPLFNLLNLSIMSSMFTNCVSLESVPLFDTRNVTTMANTFNGCYCLPSVPLFDTRNVTTMNGMFYDCRSLITVPLFNTVNVTDMGSMFVSCWNIATVPLFNTIKVVTMASMFSNCLSLVAVPSFNTPALTNTSSMFSSCNALTTVPLFNTANVTDMSSMFSNCWSLTTVPLFNMASVTNMTTTFNNCYSLKTIPSFNTPNLGNLDGTFLSCYSLTTVPLLNTSKIANFQQAFLNCHNLTTIPAFNFAMAVSLLNTFQNCYSLASIPNINASTLTNISNTFSNCYSLGSMLLTNTTQSVSFVNCKLSKNALETIFTNLGTAAAGAARTLTITNNWGAPAVGSAGHVSASGDVTEGSVTISNIVTTNLAVGMQVTGSSAAITIGRLVSFTSGTNVVNLNNHGLEDGDEVAFSTLGSPAQSVIVINKIYYVFNKTANTFQLTTNPLVGPALALTTSSINGTVKYNSTIKSIDSATSITMTRPLASTATSSLMAYRTLQTYRAILKGYTVTT
jgi:surface protein